MHASATDLLTWKQSASVRVGDTVSSYVSAPVKDHLPVSVVKTDIPYDYRGANLKIDRVMQLQLEHRYDHAQFPFSAKAVRDQIGPGSPPPASSPWKS